MRLMQADGTVPGSEARTTANRSAHCASGQWPTRKPPKLHDSVAAERISLPANATLSVYNTYGCSGLVGLALSLLLRCHRGRSRASAAATGTDRMMRVDGE